MPRPTHIPKCTSDVSVTRLSPCKSPAVSSQQGGIYKTLSNFTPSNWWDRIVKVRFFSPNFRLLIKALNHSLPRNGEKREKTNSRLQCQSEIFIDYRSLCSAVRQPHFLYSESKIRRHELRHLSLYIIPILWLTVPIDSEKVLVFNLSHYPLHYFLGNHDLIVRLLSQAICFGEGARNCSVWDCLHWIICISWIKLCHCHAVIAGDQSRKPTGVTSRVQKTLRYDSHVRKFLTVLQNHGLRVLYFVTQKGYISVADKINLTCFSLLNFSGCCSSRNVD